MLFGFSNVLRHDVWRTDSEERGLGFCGAGLSQICLTSSWRPIKKNSLPRLSNTHEYVWEHHRENDWDFQLLFCYFKSGYIFPLDVRFFGQFNSFDVVLVFLFGIARVLILLLIILRLISPLSSYRSLWILLGKLRVVGTWLWSCSSLSNGGPSNPVKSLLQLSKQGNVVRYNHVQIPLCLLIEVIATLFDVFVELKNVHVKLLVFLVQYLVRLVLIDVAS